MDALIEEFAAALKQLTPLSMATAATEIRSHADETRWLRSTFAIERALRTQRRSVEAAGAARVASNAVLAAAALHGLADDDADVECVSRRAGDVARGLLVASAVLPHVTWLLQGWQDVVPFQVQTRPQVNLPWWWGSWGRALAR